MVDITYRALERAAQALEKAARKSRAQAERIRELEFALILARAEVVEVCGFVCRCGRKNSSFGEGACIDACERPKGHVGTHEHGGHVLAERAMP